MYNDYDRKIISSSNVKSNHLKWKQLFALVWISELNMVIRTNISKHPALSCSARNYSEPMLSIELESFWGASCFPSHLSWSDVLLSGSLAFWNDMLSLDWELFCGHLNGYQWHFSILKHHSNHLLEACILSSNSLPCTVCLHMHSGEYVCSHMYVSVWFRSTQNALSRLKCPTAKQTHFTMFFHKTLKSLFLLVV